jgi:hypothetical protein
MAPAEAPYPIHGSLLSSYRGRWTNDDHDHDLYETLSLDLGDPSRNAWTGHAMTRVDADLDGKNHGQASIFNGLDDTYDGAVQVWLYDAWMQKNDVGVLDHIRLGRQTLWDTPVFAWFDGASAETKELGSDRWRIGAYGGIPVHQYDVSRSGDILGGAYAETHPWTGGRARLDGMHIEDGEQLGTLSNDLLHLGVTQEVSHSLRLDGGWTYLENENRDVSVSATYTDPEADFSARANYFQLLSTQKDRVPELDPYSATLFELFPYRQTGVLLSKGLGKQFAVQGGVDLRRITDDSNVGEFNRDFDRYFGTLILKNTLPADLTASATGEVWDSAGQDINTWGLDLSKPLGEGWDGSLGSVYALYKVDQTTGSESNNVRTYYLRARWKRSAATTWDFRYDYEDEDPNPIQTVRVGMTWRF